MAQGDGTGLSPVTTTGKGLGAAVPLELGRPTHPPSPRSPPHPGPTAPKHHPTAPTLPPRPHSPSSPKEPERRLAPRPSKGGLAGGEVENSQETETLTRVGSF